MSLPPCPAPGPHGSGLAGCPSPAECREAGKALEGCPGPAPSQHQRGGGGKEEERDWGTTGVAGPGGCQKKGPGEGPGDRRQSARILFTSCAPPSFLLSKNPLTAGSFPVSGGTKPCDTIGCCAKTSLPREQASCTATHCTDTSLYPGIPEAELRQGHWRDFKTSLSYSVRKVLSLHPNTQKPDVWNGGVSRKERWETVVLPFKPQPGPSASSPMSGSL